jgi:TonB family protein
MEVSLRGGMVSFAQRVRKRVRGKSFVESVANTPAENEAVQGTATSRPNPVAFETPVNVTGARPSSEEARDLFTEETRTILVFVDGAVIQLTSPVSEGQLLFLTNKKSNEEVVCQVLHKRRFGAAACYVELQFTEDKPNYWGVAFPKEKKRSAEFAAAEHVAAAQTTEQGAGTLPPVRSEKDVDDLKTQVEELRKQLVEVEKKNAAEAALKEVEEAKASAARVLEQRGSANQTATDKHGPPATGEALLMPPATAETKSPGLAVKMALPTQPKEPGEKSAKEAEAERLPKPELDFSKVPQAANAEEIAARASLKGASPWRGKLRAAGFIVILAAVGLAAYEKLSPYVSSLRKNAPSGSAAAKIVAPQAGVAAKTADNGAAPEGTAKTVEDQDAAAGNATTSATTNEATGSAPEVAKPPVESVVTKPAAERSARKSTAKQRVVEAAPADVVPADAPVISAKLLHAASPVYPPDAMRSYITGDVKAELVVEANGKVGEVKVLSGPNALRQAAVEALKKYEYAPATQGGKPVASKTTAVVKFWFNP